MQSRLWLSLLILGFLGLCDAAHVADVATDAFDQSTSPQAAVASALITSKTSFAKHVEGKTGFLPGLLEESESLLMESELEMDTKEDSEIISTPSEAVSDNGFCSLLLVLRSILLALLLHLAVVYKRKIQIEATRATRASARPSCASKTPNACDTSDTSNPETEPKTTSLVSDSISDTHSSQFELSELHPQTPQTPQTWSSATPAQSLRALLHPSLWVSRTLLPFPSPRMHSGRTPLVLHYPQAKLGMILPSFA
mmetsp:Transcript_58244/g.94656  ORF Transcript_58244/g.94656 Transcript_58244/m.94656 type:complete len:254 (+) Transcript_58244:159-920(+)